jgi:hypothetical protein
MHFDVDFTVTQESTDAEENVTLGFWFSDANLNGNFFGYPVDYRRRGGVLKSFSDPNVIPVRTAANQKFTPPDGTAFDAPIFATVGANGVVKDIQHGKGFGDVFATIMDLAVIDFPESSLYYGDVWESDSTIAVPGLDNPVPIRVTSTFTGEDIYAGQPCVRIDQVISPSTAPPESRVGKIVDKVSGGRAPKLTANGYATSYFNLSYGRLVYSTIDVTIDLQMGSSLESATNFLGSYIGLLDELEGGNQVDLNTDSSVMPGIQITAVVRMK